MAPERDPRKLICSCGGPKSRAAHKCARCSGKGETPEQRDNHALCGAKTRNGTSCRAWAGMGTDHPGIGACRFHAGATPAHGKHAIALEAKRRMIQLGTPIEDITAPKALMGLLKTSAGTVKWVRDEIAELVVVPEDVVHPGLFGGWLVSKPPVPRRTPDEVAR
jgi:hypothetical protein